MSKYQTYGYRCIDGRPREVIDCSKDELLTEQHHLQACDINVIMASYEKTGQVPVYSNMQPLYEDFTMVADYQSALNAVISAEEAFMSLPANVRSAFDNNPALLIEAINDPTQRDRLIGLGLINPVDPTGAVQPIIQPEPNLEVSGS